MSARGDMCIGGEVQDAGDGPPEAWPPQVDLILSAIDAGRDAEPHDRRAVPRHSYRVRGWLRLFSDGRDGDARPVYTRDANPRGVGFITPHRLPLGYGGTLELPHPDGGTAVVHCTILRCREASPGWFEGSVYFNREQSALFEKSSRAEGAGLTLAT